MEKTWSCVTIKIMFIFPVYIIFCALQIAFWTVLFGRIFYGKKPQKKSFFLENSNKKEESDFEKISVVICGRNEAENFRKFLPLVLQQNYPNFEVIVVNDASCDDSEIVLRELARTYANLQIISLNNAENRVLKGKKHALTAGINSTTSNWILVTDADCAPSSSNWISAMFAETKKNRTKKTNIVLGYSPYCFEKNWLNTWIRFETVYTALQYFGMAAWGAPYMGVGRNMLYNKALFIQNNGLNAHGNLHSGDDDLFMRDVATAHNTTFCLNLQSFVKSVPKKNLKAYLQQKQRHLSTATSYKLQTQLILGLLSFSQIGVFCFFALNVFLGNLENLPLVFALFLLRWLSFLDTIRRAKTVFQERFSWFDALSCDVLLTVYLVFFAFKMFLPAKKNW